MSRGSILYENSMLQKVEKVVALIFILFTVVSVTVQATSSPTIGWAITGGNQGPNDWFVSMDGTTPVARAQAQETIGSTIYRPGDNYVGFAGQDPAAFVVSLIVDNITVSFDSAVFPTRSSISYTNKGVRITGNGFATIFKPPSGTFDVFSLNGNDNILEYVTIDTSLMTGGYAVHIGSTTTSNRFTIRNTSMQIGSTTGGIWDDTHAGVGFIYANRIQSILNPIGDAIHISNAADQHITFNDIGGFGGGSTIGCSECTDIEISNNQLYVGLFGVDLYLPKEIRFNGNHCGFFQTDCIRLHADLSGIWSGITINGNVFDGNRNGFAKPYDINIYASGAGLNTISNVAITGNVFSAGVLGAAGLNVQTSVSNMTIIGNTFNSATPIIGSGLTTSKNLQICCNAGVGNLSPVTDYTTGLSLWWKFDDGTGTSITDSSGNSQTGTLTSSTWSTCKLNDCIYVAGSGFAQKSSGFTMPTSYTMSLWMFINSTTYGSGNQFIFGQLQSGANTGILVWLTNTQTLTFRMVNAAIGSNTCTETPIFQNFAWNFLTFAFNSTSNVMSMYVNRNLINSSCTFSGTLPVYNGNLEVGDAPSQSPGIKAYIDDFRIYNSFLSQSNINEIYQFGTSGQAP